MDKSKTKKKEDVLNKFDPALVRVAIMELASDVKRLDKKDIEKAKEQLRQVYESIPEAKDRVEILTKALTEFNSEIIIEEIKKVKEELKDFTKTELIEIDKTLVEVTPICWSFSIIPCKSGCIMYSICAFPLGCSVCLKYAICAYPLGGCPACINYAICAYPLGGCPGCINYMIFGDVCKGGKIFVTPPKLCPDITPPLIPGLEELIVNPVWTEQVVNQLLQNPQLSKGIRKLIAEMKEQGEI